MVLHNWQSPDLATKQPYQCATLGGLFARSPSTVEVERRRCRLSRQWPHRRFHILSRIRSPTSRYSPKQSDSESGTALACKLGRKLSGSLESEKQECPVTARRPIRVRQTPSLVCQRPTTRGTATRSTLRKKRRLPSSVPRPIKSCSERTTSSTLQTSCSPQAARTSAVEYRPTLTQRPAMR